MSYKKTMLADVDRFLNGGETIFAERTIENYGHALRRLADWVERCSIDPDEITPALVKLFLDDQPNWGPPMRHVAIGAMRSFYKWRYGSAHPVMAYHEKKAPTPPQRSLSVPQLLRLFEIFDTSTPKGVRDLALVTLMLDTGLRATEICNLDVRYLFLEKNDLWVVGKMSKEYTPRYSPYTAACLENWLAVRNSCARPGVKNVFVGFRGTSKGKKMTRHGLKTIFGYFAEKAGFSALSPHDLRRTMACIMTELGAPARVTQMQGGWSHIDMVERYTRNVVKRAADAYSPVMQIMTGGKGTPNA